jgi:hypothetical protein
MAAGRGQAVGINGRAGALGLAAQPRAHLAEEVASEERAVVAKDIEDSAYRALISFAQIRTSGENLVAFSRSCDSPNSMLAEAEFSLDRETQSGQMPDRGPRGRRPSFIA